MKKHPNVNFCFGIDPNPSEMKFEYFRTSLLKHMEFLDSISYLPHSRILKPQLAFFLSYGSAGIKLLEEFVAQYNTEYTIIIDAKFNDIANTLQAYLKFVFNSLGAHGVTISPFLGEKTISTSLEECVKHCGKKGRVYILCATSEASHGKLSYIQNEWKQIIEACVNVRNEVLQEDSEFSESLGVVVGANRESVLFSNELIQSELSILSPGLGAQGASFEIIEKCSKLANEITFPMSRGIFGGGNISVHEIQKNYDEIKNYF